MRVSKWGSWFCNGLYKCNICAIAPRMRQKRIPTVKSFEGIPPQAQAAPDSGSANKSGGGYKPARSYETTRCKPCTLES